MGSAGLWRSGSAPQGPQPPPAGRCRAQMNSQAGLIDCFVKHLWHQAIPCVGVGGADLLNPDAVPQGPQPPAACKHVSRPVSS